MSCCAQAGYNQITSIPGELGRLSRLAELHLSCNRLEALPPDLGRALPPGGALTELGLSGNPLGAPLSQVCLPRPAVQRHRALLLDRLAGRPPVADLPDWIIRSDWLHHSCLCDGPDNPNFRCWLYYRLNTWAVMPGGWPTRAPRNLLLCVSSPGPALDSDWCLTSARNRPFPLFPPLPTPSADFPARNRRCPALSTRARPRRALRPEWRGGSWLPPPDAVNQGAAQVRPAGASSRRPAAYASCTLA